MLVVCRGIGIGAYGRCFEIGFWTHFFACFSIDFSIHRNSQRREIHRREVLFLLFSPISLILTLSLARNNLTHRDILEELPLEVSNSHLITSLLHSIDAPVLAPNYDTLDLSIDPYLERNLEHVIDRVDEWTYEQGNLQYFQRQLGREQAKIAAWQAKRVSSWFLGFKLILESGEFDESGRWTSTPTRR